MEDRSTDRYACPECGASRWSYVDDSFPTGVAGETRYERGWICRDCGYYEEALS